MHVKLLCRVSSYTRLEFWNNIQGITQYNPIFIGWKQHWSSLSASLDIVRLLGIQKLLLCWTEGIWAEFEATHWCVVLFCSGGHQFSKLPSWTWSSRQKPSAFATEVQAGLWSKGFICSKLTGCTDRVWTIEGWTTNAWSVNVGAGFGKWTLLSVGTEGWWNLSVLRVCASASLVLLSSCCWGGSGVAAASWMKVGSVCNLRPRERLLLRRFEGRGCPKDCWIGLGFRPVAPSTTGNCSKEHRVCFHGFRQLKLTRWHTQYYSL